MPRIWQATAAAIGYASCASERRQARWEIGHILHAGIRHDLSQGPRRHIETYEGLKRHAPR